MKRFKVISEGSSHGRVIDTETGRSCDVPLFALGESLVVLNHLFNRKGRKHHIYNRHHRKVYSSKPYREGVHFTKVWGEDNRTREMELVMNRRNGLTIIRDFEGDSICAVSEEAYQYAVNYYNE